MKKIIPLIAMCVIIVYLGVLLASPKSSDSTVVSMQNTEQTTSSEPSLASLVPKEVPVTTVPATTKPVSTPSTSTPKSTPTQSSPKPNEYTMSQIATHNSASSCWSVVNGYVYDLTSFINQHPGGSGAIKSLCGRDGTSSFEDQHGGQRRPEQELASLKIGTLVK